MEHNPGWIRAGQPEDKTIVARLMIQAMEDLVRQFVDNADPYAAQPAFEFFFEGVGNMYSHEHTLVYEDGEGIGGSATAYDGAQLIQLRQPVLTYLAEHYGFGRAIEPETAGGEFYLDTVSVAAHKQGRGIGKLLIAATIDRAEALGHQQVGLLVDAHNPDAKTLYQRMGFEVVDKKSFMGGVYEHMTIKI